MTVTRRASLLVVLAHPDDEVFHGGMLVHLSQQGVRVTLVCATKGEAGTFELSGSNTITMQATVAKNPAAMTPGAASVYTYRREGELLTLTQVRTPTGPMSNPVTIKLTRVE